MLSAAPVFALATLLAQTEAPEAAPEVPIREELRAALTTDGAANYLQVVDYELDVNLDPAEKKLRGGGKVTWTNRTRFPVRDLWWHLYLNAFRNDRSTLMRESSGGKLRKDVFDRGEWGYIDVKKVELEGGGDLTPEMKFEHPDDDNEEDRTVLRTPLPREVGPGESITLKFEFDAKLPKVFARSGWGGEFLMVAQWFPKIAVLEEAGDRSVWNCHQYHANGEFFADYGRFKVAITVPKGFEVGASGKLVETRTAKDGTTTFVHELDRVHDFAWTADPRFQRIERRFEAAREVTPEQRAEVASLLGIDAESLKLTDVDVTLLIQPEHVRYAERYLRATFEGIRWFGLWYGAYPYETLTVVDGPRLARGAMGMEYPTLITGGVRWPADPDMPIPESVTVHEFGHQYWYGLVGSNEFEEAWLDEGFNTYSTGKVLDRAYGKFIYAPDLLNIPLTPWFPGARLDQLEFLLLSVRARPTPDQIGRRAWEFRDSLSYGINSYSRTALALRQLELDIGAQNAARALRLYHLRWRYRHPKMGEFVRAVEEVTNRPMEEYFRRGFYTPGTVDYAITKFESNRLKTAAGYFDGGKVVSLKEADEADEVEGAPQTWETAVIVERKGQITRPVNVEVSFTDGTKQRASWNGEYSWERLRFKSPTRATAARLHPDGELLLDASRMNDSRTLSRDAHPAVTWGAHLLYTAQTIFQIVGAWL